MHSASLKQHQTPRSANSSLAAAQRRCLWLFKVRTVHPPRRSSAIRKLLGNLSLMEAAEMSTLIALISASQCTLQESSPRSPCHAVSKDP